MSVTAVAQLSRRFVRVLSMVAEFNGLRRPGVLHHEEHGEGESIKYDMYDIKQFFPHIHPDELRATVRATLRRLRERHGGIYKWF